MELQISSMWMHIIKLPTALWNCKLVRYECILQNYPLSYETKFPDLINTYHLAAMILKYFHESLKPISIKQTPTGLLQKLAQLVRGKGKVSLTFFKNWKKMSWFWKKIPRLFSSMGWIVHLKCSFKKRKNWEIFPCGPFLFKMKSLSMCPYCNKPFLP